MTNDIKKLILFHPPSFNRDTLQLDGYCSQRQKGSFRWHPVDFVALQSFYRNEIEVEIIDSGDQKDLDNSVYEKIKDNNNLIIGLIGVHGFAECVKFYQKLLAVNEKLILTGDIARSDPEFVFNRIKNLKYIIPELSKPPSFADLREKNTIDKLWKKGDASYIIPEFSDFTIGIQDFTLWEKNKYAIPFTLKKPFASVITQVGCPYKCPYCIMHSYDLSVRDYDELDQELKTLKEQGVKHLYIRDATFNSSIAHVKKVTELIKKYSFHWNAFFDLRSIKDYIPLIAGTNLKVAMIGFDFLNEGDRIKHRKIVNISEKDVIRMFHNNKIKVTGHYLLLKNKKNYIKKLVINAILLNLDWFTFSPVELRPGSINFSPEENVEYKLSEDKKSMPYILFFYLNPLNIMKNIQYYLRNFNSYFRSLIKVFL